MVYRFDSEGGIPLRLKVEVNCREHHTIFGIQDVKYAMQSEWHTGEVLIPSYQLAELLGTKMRALYQRRKGRDLFDMWFAIILEELKLPGKRLVMQSVDRSTSLLEESGGTSYLRYDPLTKQLIISTEESIKQEDLQSEHVLSYIRWG